MSSCRIFYDSDALDPADKAVVPGIPPGAAVRRCVIGDSSPIFSQMSAVGRSRSGVCSFTESIISTEPQQTPPEGSFLAKPLLLKTVTTGPCPKQESRSYIVTEEMPDEVFAALLRFWNDMRTPATAERILKETATDVASEQDFQEFWAAMKREPKPSLEQIENDSDETYTLVVSSEDASWTVAVLRRQGRLSIAAVGAIVDD